MTNGNGLENRSSFVGEKFLKSFAKQHISFKKSVSLTFWMLMGHDVKHVLSVKQIKEVLALSTLPAKTLNDALLL